MTNDILKGRFIQDTVSVRLGNLAVHLNRIQSWAEDPANGNLVYSLIKESRSFVEWTTPDMEIKQALQLTELGRYLARCLSDWDKTWNDPESRNQLAQDVGSWSERVLQMSGLDLTSSAE
ncbi:MAG TPA: hypothetical protein VK203_26980 [Nostocaceae cyanobacterium]|nr:hypothetical protein [Nostocaceae cyanobacterium]